MSDRQQSDRSSPQLDRSSSADAEIDASASLLEKKQSNLLFAAPRIALFSVVLISSITACILYINHVDVLGSVEDFVRRSGPLGVFVFMALYALLAALFLPASILTLAAGYLFGLVTGVVAVSIAATVGATLGFLVARYLCRPGVESSLRESPEFARIDAGIAARGAWVVFLLRLSPVFPYSLLNAVLGFTRVELVPFAAASWVGMLPGTFAYVYLGTLGKQAAKEAKSGGFTIAQGALYFFGVVATIWVTIIISRIARKALDTPVEGSDSMA